MNNTLKVSYRDDDVCVRLRMELEFGSSTCSTCSFLGTVRSPADMDALKRFWESEEQLTASTELVCLIHFDSDSPSHRVAPQSAEPCPFAQVWPQHVEQLRVQPGGRTTAIPETLAIPIGSAQEHQPHHEGPLTECAFEESSSSLKIENVTRYTIRFVFFVD